MDKNLDDVEKSLDQMNLNNSGACQTGERVENDEFINLHSQVPSSNMTCDPLKETDLSSQTHSQARDSEDEYLSADEGQENCACHCDTVEKDASKRTFSPTEDDEFVGASGGDDETGSDKETVEEKEKKEEELRKKVEESLTDDEKQERKTLSQKQKEEGNQLFKDGHYEEALELYTKALNLCPFAFPKERSIMFSNRAACRMRLDKNEEAIADCSKALELHPHYLKALLRRAELYEKVDKLDEALADFTKVVEMDSSQHAARAAAMRLSQQIKDRNEKMKEEMIGKLKDLGNMILKPFGLSTNNFQMTQDPNTGGYSVQFKQN